MIDFAFKVVVVLVAIGFVTSIAMIIAHIIQQERMH